MTRLRYAARFLYWSIRHGSLSRERWVMDYEGNNWK